MGPLALQQDHPEALDFDHLPGTKKLFSIGSKWMKVTREQLDAEIAKCEVVCATHHRVRTALRREERDSHVDPCL